MSLSKKGIQAIDLKLPNSSKSTTLNPDASEFIPFALRSPAVASAIDTDASTNVVLASGSTGKAVINRSDSSATSNNSDDEAHQFWRHQLPDDITPDFKVVDEDLSQGLSSLSLAGLSLCHDSDAVRFSTPTVGGFPLKTRQELLPDQLTLSGFAKKMGYGGSSVSEDTSPGRLVSANPWDKQIVNNDLIFGSSREAPPFKGGSKHALVGDVFGDHGIVDDVAAASHLEFLVLNFPGFAADCAAEVYYANGCDLNMTIEMLTQLELQIDGAFSPNLNLKSLSDPNLSTIDFPAFSSPEGQLLSQKNVGDDLQSPNFPYRSPHKDSLPFKSGYSAPFRGAAIDFAAAVKKVPTPESSIWKYNKNGSAHATSDTSRSSQMLAGAHHGGIGRGNSGDRVPNRASARAAPVWLETGDAVANLYSELREEAHDHARLRNAYFEQAQQAYLVGNKALAEELSVKGQLHGMHMKAAHGKAQESIYRQRNPVRLDLRGNGRGKERMIDLHDLHVSEAINVLKSELGKLRAATRAANQCLQVYICVWTGHHTRGSRAPARLPVAVQRYLLEEEGLEYSEPQPGLLRVLIY